MARRTPGGGAVALAVLAGTGTSGVAVPAPRAPRWFGAIPPTLNIPSQLVAAEVRRVALSVGWDLCEASSVVVSTQHVSQLRPLLAETHGDVGGSIVDVTALMRGYASMDSTRVVAPHGLPPEPVARSCEVTTVSATTGSTRPRRGTRSSRTACS